MEQLTKAEIVTSVSEDVEKEEYKLFQYLLDEFNIAKVKSEKFDFQWEYPLDDIRTIDGIRVDVEFKFYRNRNHKDSMFMIISNPNCCNNQGEPYEMYRQRLTEHLITGGNDITDLMFEDIAHGYEEFIDYLTQLHYDRMTSRFAVKPDRNFDNSLALQRIFTCNDKVKKDDRVCCVCLEKSTTLTSCHHILCLVCWHQIIENQLQYDNEGEEEAPCPLCRKDLCLHSNYFH